MLFGLLSTSDFPARWYCGNWSALHGWVHVVSDVAIFGAYFAIPVALIHFARRRRDVPFLPVFWLFGAFILLCGLGHLIEATIFWQPWYRLSAVVKAATALVSWATVAALVPIVPRALEMPGLAQMNEQLRSTNEELERFAEGVTDREERVIELKQEVNALLRELGREERYLRGMVPDGR